MGVSKFYLGFKMAVFLPSLGLKFDLTLIHY